MAQLIAHVKQNSEGKWDSPHDLIAHLNNTACLAEKFASVFKSENWAKTLGLLHDAGKSTANWQEYLKTKSGYGYDSEAHLEGKVGKLDHSSIGARLAEE